MSLKGTVFSEHPIFLRSGFLFLFLFVHRARYFIFWVFEDSRDFSYGLFSKYPLFNAQLNVN